MSISNLKAGSEEGQDSTLSCHKNIRNLPSDDSSSVSAKNECDTLDSKRKGDEREGEFHSARGGQASISSLSNSTTFLELSFPPRISLIDHLVNTKCLESLSLARRDFPGYPTTLSAAKENERLSITIPQIGHDLCGAISPSPSLLMTSSSQCLTPSSPASVIPPSLPPSRRDGEIPEGVNKILFLNDESLEEEKIDVCTVKESQSIVNNDKNANRNGKENLVLYSDEGGIDMSKKDPTAHFYSYLGSECSRTVPSLMKYYSKHKRSLSTSLSVTLAVSGQSTPPCSPISPGTTTSVLPYPKRSLEASTMTSPTDRSVHASSDYFSSFMQKEKQKYSVDNSQAASSSLAALTLLTIPNLTNDKSGRLSPVGDMRSESKLDEEKQAIPKGDESDGLICPAPSSVSLENSSVDTPVCSMPPGITFPTPWSLPHNAIPHPGSFWLHSGVDAGTGLNLGYHVARDPLTGHLFIIGRHPMADPNGHGLMWAGYGGVHASHMMMSAQQMLLDPRYRPSLHAPPPPPSLMQMHHPHPGLHPQQQQQSPRNFNLTNKEASKKSPIPLSEEPNNQPTDLSMQSLPPPNISPHYLYPPTTIPYYYPPPTHPNPFSLPAYAQRPIPATSLGLTTAMQNNLLAPLTSNIFTSSSSTLTTTTSESILLSEKLAGSCVVADLSISKENIAQMRNGVPIADATNNLVPDPMMNQTDSHSIKSCLYEVKSLPGKDSSYKDNSIVPNTIHIKEEIKEEETYQCCLINKECNRHIASDNFLSLKVESNSTCTPTPDDIVTNTSTCVWDSTDVSKHYENNSLDIHKNNTTILSSSQINDSVDNYENTDTKVASTAPKNVIDSSGLELLLQTFLQHGDRLAPSPQAKDSDQDSVSSVSEQMPHLERVTSTPSPRVSPASFESQPPVLTPFTLRIDAESPRLSSSPTIHHPLDNVLEDPIPHYLPPKPSGLSVLCALAEQRILEEQQNSCSALSSLAEVASSTPSVPMHSPLSEISEQLCSSSAVPELIAESSSFNVDVPEAMQENTQMVSNTCPENNDADINRNYKSPKSEREVRAFIANKVSQYQKEISTDEEASTAYQLGTMKAVERDMKMKLADLQRQYKLKQRELSRLHPKKEFIGIRRKRGRPPKPKHSSAVDMESKSGPSFIKTDLDHIPSLILNKSESRIEAHDKSPFMQATSSLSLQTKTQTNGNINNSWQLKMEDTSDEDEVRTSPSNSPSNEAFFKSPFLILHPKHEESEEGQSGTDIQHNKDEKTETSVESSTSDVEHSVSSSSKKRKPGRPKKHSLTKFEATETIVAKKPKGFEFLLASHKSKIRPKLKAELKVRLCEQEDEASINSSQITFNNPAMNEENVENKDDLPKATNVGKGVRRRGGPMGRSSVSRNTLLRDKEKRKSVFEKNSRMQELFRSLKRYSTIAAAEHDESEDEKEYKPVLSCEKNKENLDEESHNIDLNRTSPAHDLPKEQTTVGAELLPEVSVPSDQAEVQVKPESNVPDDTLLNNEIAPVVSGEEVNVKVEEEPDEEIVESNDNNVDKEECSVCSLQIEDLVRGARVLILQDGLLYAGSLAPITPPDVYGIHIDGERGTRHHIYCQEDLLTQAWKEVKPGSTRFLTEGTRVCAFWSQQYRGLYPGCVAAACSPSHEGNHNLVNVEFDDGDSGRIHVDDIRLLPQHFPIIEYDPNPLLTLNKRKRRLTGEDQGDGKFSQQKHVKLSQNEHQNGPENSGEENENCAVAEKDEKKIKPRRKQKRKRVLQSSLLSRDDRKRHKKRKKASDLFLFKHKHRRKHKRKRKLSGAFPHVEQGDNELRMRIKSPPPMKEERNSSTEDEMAKSENEEPSSYQPQPIKKRSPSEKSKMAPFLLERQLWRWFGKGYRRPGSKGKGKKLFYKEIVRGKDHIRVGDCAVFLSSGSHERPFIGKIDFLWEGWGGNMVVKVRWFYHPDETIGTERKLSEPKGALFSSSHTDENDVQTISHKCHVVSLAEYRVRRAELDRKRGEDYENFDLYYLAGFYDPTYSRITMEPGVS